MKKKINFIDILIVLFVVFALLFVVKYFSTSSKKANDAPTVSYVVELKSVIADSVEVFKEGLDVKDSIKGGYLGKITKVEVKDNVEIRENTVDGKFVKSTFPNKKDVYVTIEGTPTTFSDSDIMFANQSVKIGKVMYLKTKDFVGHGYVTGIQIMDKGDEKW